MLFLLEEEEEADIEFEVKRLRIKKRTTNVKIPLKQVEIHPSPYFNILNWSEHIDVIARELTFISHSIYRSVKPVEMVGKGWCKKERKVLSPHIVDLITRFDNLTRWVIEEILSYDRKVTRVKVIALFVELAEECLKLGNLQDTFVIENALSSGCLLYLEKTWNMMDSNTIESKRNLANICSFKDNYQGLRTEQAKREDKFCIPCLPLYLKELAFIEEGPKYVKNDYLVNIHKVNKVYSTISEYLSYQKYNFLYVSHKKLAFLGNISPLPEKNLMEMTQELG